MDNRIAGRFVVDNGNVNEVDTLAHIETLILQSMGYGYEQSGKTLDITVTIKTVPGPQWVRCAELGYYSNSNCGALIAPGTKCTAEHHHKPDWVESEASDADDGHICRTCSALGIAPSRKYNADSAYNHSNTGAAR